MSFYKKVWLYFLLLTVLTSASSCGFRPLFNDYSVKNEIIGSLKISNVFGKEGYHLKEELVRRFGTPSEDAYFLNLEVETSKINEVISPSNEITSYRLIMTVDYEIRNSLGEIVLPNQKSVVRTGFSSASNSTGYATQIAEEAAKKRLSIKTAERISTRLFILSETWLK